MKDFKPYYGWLFAVVTLAILLGISIYLGISGWYFTTEWSRSSDIVLGNNVEMSVKKNQAASCSFSFSGGFLPGEKLAQIVSVKNAGEDGKVLLRAKVYVFMTDSNLADIQFITSEHWVKGDDGYYYFTDEVLAQSKVNICSHVVISENSTLASEKSYIMTVLVEALDSSLDSKSVWGVNPLELQND